MDRIDRLNKKLQEVKEAFDAWQKVGIDEEILIIYIKEKTGAGKKTIRDILYKQKEFFDNLIKGETIKKLEDGSEDKNDQ